MKASCSSLAVCSLRRGVRAAAPGARRPIIVIALANSPDESRSRASASTRRRRSSHQLLFSSLLKIDADLRVVPDLAVRFETDGFADVRRRDSRGVRFHDGREMTAEDVAFTFRRFLDPAFVSGAQGRVSRCAPVDVVDPLHGRVPAQSAVGVVSDQPGHGHRARRHRARRPRGRRSAADRTGLTSSFPTITSRSRPFDRHVRRRAAQRRPGLQSGARRDDARTGTAQGQRRPRRQRPLARSGPRAPAARAG